MALDEASNTATPIRPRVVFIGPVQPYRGGISQHGTMLHTELSKQTDCLTLSFSRQYPQWLFPGKSDKDPESASLLKENIEYTIDSLNMFTWWRASKRIARAKPEILILPWWHVYWTFCFGFMLYWLRDSAAEKVIIVHNLVEHESANWKQRLTKMVLSRADRFLVHSAADRDSLQTLFPQKPISVHPLPLSDQFPRVSSSAPRRASLELLFFGFVRPYKGLSVLLDAMVLLKDRDVFLSIVGEFWEGYEEAVNFITVNGLSQQIEIINRYLPDLEAAKHLERCDVVIMPYLSATGSGIVPLAYHYEKPVIASRTGGIPDVVVSGSTGRLVEPGNVEDIAAAIEYLLEGGTLVDPAAMAQMRAKLSWTTYARALLSG